MGGVAGTSFGGENNYTVYTLNKAAWTSFLGTAVVIRMFFPVILLPKKIFIFLLLLIMHRGRENLFRSVHNFFYGDGPRELPPYQQHEEIRKYSLKLNSSIICNGVRRVGFVTLE